MVISRKLAVLNCTVFALSQQWNSISKKTYVHFWARIYSIICKKLEFSSFYTAGVVCTLLPKTAMLRKRVNKNGRNV